VDGQGELGCPFQSKRKSITSEGWDKAERKSKKVKNDGKDRKTHRNTAQKGFEKAKAWEKKKGSRKKGMYPSRRRQPSLL